MRYAGADQPVADRLEREGYQRHLLRLGAAQDRLPMLAELDPEQKINLDDLISRTYRFDDINEGFALMLAGEVARGASSSSIEERPAGQDRGVSSISAARRSAQVAQLVEQRTENPCVGGSIPPLGTTIFPFLRGRARQTEEGSTKRTKDLVG